MKGTGRRFGRRRLRVQFDIAILVLTVIPIFLAGLYIFHTMNQNTISSARTYMQDTMERQQPAVNNELETLQMLTQYLQDDTTMHDLLSQAVSGEKADTQQLRSVYSDDIKQIQQLLYSNPSLYSLRIYATNNNVTEMMPILYRHDRMEQQAWAKDAKPSGYYFDYADQIFEGRNIQDSAHLIGLVTPMEDDALGTIGYIETSVGIPYIFPDIDESKEGEEGFLILSNGRVVKKNGSNTAMKNAALQAISQNKNDDTTGEDITTSILQINHKQYVISSMYIRQMKANYVTVLDLSGRLARQRNQKILLTILLASMMVLLGVVVNVIVDWLLRDFYRILKTVVTVQNGDMTARVPALKEGDTAILGREINTMLDRIDGLMKENLDRQLLEKNAQIRALENQINAHFIYNVLESINMMAEIDGEYEICDAVVTLGDMMRYSLRWSQGMVTVQEEVHYTEDYATLMNIRLDGEVKLTENISEELLHNEIPKMVLQPLVENALNHGYAEEEDEKEIEIAAEVIEDKACIHVRDHGCGMTKEQLAALLQKMDETPDQKQKHGYALRNIRERIRYLCGPSYGLTIISEPGKGTDVTVLLPYKKQDAGKQEGISHE